MTTLNPTKNYYFDRRLISTTEIDESQNIETKVQLSSHRAFPNTLHLHTKKKGHAHCCKIYYLMEWGTKSVHCLAQAWWNHAFSCIQTAHGWSGRLLAQS